ncbi:uncharacterized protein SPPG_00794 [Spizellomyces punctatus DAOM BR117]|uniref:CSC1/OSCA1-like 7TM region domain-containing protein n=1 Tax=Spizellomyces punctatus (strain DAOM BR117) TaxID=645134 RepID=A0A0L0HW73_SPIPD|nr:uncharacterized protein SPPG_00794 [Spizellomyces punctatus DAOM BR117]KND05124.1 hypothetical protein SPPG_00794 [Spizellomyces punctatus DAOM BR117]|eukprot:XP_016613163.1 hypothetical protein SPPG_00794 [Spizellomyces punctatus DAOM BR117]
MSTPTNETNTPPSPSLPTVGVLPTPIYYVADPSISGAWLWFGIASAVTVVCVLVYELIRRRHGLRRVLYTRVATNRRETPPIPMGKFGWLKPVRDLPESYIAENVGLDAVMFLRFLRMCCFIIIGLICVLIPILIPVNVMSNPPDSESRSSVNSTSGRFYFGKESLERYSFSSVPPGSSFLWAHIVCAYFVSAVTYYFLFTSYRDYARLAASYIHEDTGVMTKRTPEWRKGELVQLRTILVQNIPDELQRDDKLKAWFESLEIGEVEAATLDRDAGNRLLRLAKQRERALKKLERSYVKWLVNIDIERTKRKGGKVWMYTPGRLLRLHSAKLDLAEIGIDELTLERLRPVRRKQRTRGKSSSWSFGTGSDEIDYFTKKLTDLTVQLKHLRQIGKGDPGAVYRDPKTVVPTAAAFVTFRTQRAAQLAVQVLLRGSDNYWSMSIRLAPAVQDVLWENISLPAWRRELQSWSITVLSCLFSFFWIVPTSLIASLTSLDSLAKVPAFEKMVTNIAKSPQLYFLIKTVGPPLVVNSFNLIVPFILEWMSYRQGIESNSHVERATMSKYFFFLFFNIFFVFTLAQTIFRVVGEFLQNPISIINLAVEVLPQGATFFINYIILNLMLFPLELLRPGIMVLMFLGRWLIKTPREFHELSIYSSYLNYGMLYPMHVLIFIIVICYSIIAPLILLPGAIYFALGWVVYRNQLLFVYVKEWESFGQHWVMAFKRCVTGLGVMQVLLAGMLAVKNAPTPSALCIPLIIMTIIFYVYCRKVFEKQTYLVPLDQFTWSARKEKAQTQPVNDIGFQTASQPSLLAPPSVTETLDQPRRSGQHSIAPTDLSDEGSSARRPSLAASSTAAAPTDDPYPPMDIVTSAEQHALERYPTSYLNPMLSKPLPRPWVPVSIAEWWGRLPQFSSRHKKATNSSEIPRDSMQSTRSTVEQLQNRRPSTYAKLKKPGIQAAATAGAIALAVGAPSRLSEEPPVHDFPSQYNKEAAQEESDACVPALHVEAAEDEDGTIPIEMLPMAEVQPKEFMRVEEGNEDDVEKGMAPSASESSMARLVKDTWDLEEEG